MLLYGTLLYVVPVYLGLVIVSPEYKYMASSCTVFYESLFTAKTLIVHHWFAEVCAGEITGPEWKLLSM